VDVAQQEGLADNQRCDPDVHGISDMAVGAFDDKVSRWNDGSRRADALQGEASETFKHHSNAGGHQQDADRTKGRET
jgi:hypothetical protein